MTRTKPDEYRITPKARNIHVVELNAIANGPPSKWEYWVLLRGDAHHDNPHCDHELEKKHLLEVEERRGLWLDDGDLFCAMGGKWDPRGAKHGTTRPEHAMANDYTDSLVRHAADFYAPHAHRCITIGRGNHEQSILKRHETDLTERLCQSLRDRTGCALTAGGYGGWVKFVVYFSDESCSTFDLKYFHGSGGGGMMSFDSLRVRRQASYLPDADVIVCGHVHESWHLSIGRERLRSQNGDFRIQLDEQHHVRTGTYKDEYGDGHSGFHIERGGPPKAIGAVWMRIRLGVDLHRRYSRPVLDFMQAR